MARSADSNRLCQTFIVSCVFSYFLRIPAAPWRLSLRAFRASPRHLGWKVTPGLPWPCLRGFFIGAREGIEPPWLMPNPYSAPLLWLSQDLRLKVCQDFECGSPERTRTVLPSYALDAPGAPYPGLREVPRAGVRRWPSESNHIMNDTKTNNL